MFSPLNQIEYHNANADRWLRFEVSLGTINKVTMIDVLGFHRQCHLHRQKEIWQHMFLVYKRIYKLYFTLYFNDTFFTCIEKTEANNHIKFYLYIIKRFFIFLFQWWCGMIFFLCQQFLFIYIILLFRGFEFDSHMGTLVNSIYSTQVHLQRVSLIFSI